MCKIFQINYAERLEVQKYTELFEVLDGDMSTYERLESRCVNLISDDIVYVRWNSQGHMMGWKRISEETEIPIEIIKHFRNTPEYKESLRKRLKVIGIDMIDGLSMKKDKHPPSYMANKFGINPIDILGILSELEPRSNLRRRSFSEDPISQKEIKNLIHRTQRYLQHKICFQKSEQTSQQAIEWLANRRYVYDPIFIC